LVVHGFKKYWLTTGGGVSSRTGPDEVEGFVLEDIGGGGGLFARKPGIENSLLGTVMRAGELSFAEAGQAGDQARVEFGVFMRILE
jgi:hypothetical protein